MLVYKVTLVRSEARNISSHGYIPKEAKDHFIEKLEWKYVKEIREGTAKIEVHSYQTSFIFSEMKWNKRTNLEQLVVDRMNEVWEWAKKKYHLMVSYDLDAKFDLRGERGGVAKLRHREMRINSILLKENVDEYLNNIVPHEVAHFVSWELSERGEYYDGAHGPTWKDIMLDMGLSTYPYHFLDTTNCRRKRS